MSDELLRGIGERLAAQVDDSIFDYGPGADKVAGDTELLDFMLNSGSSASRLRIWDNSRSLIVSRRVSRAPGFAAASLAARRRGWPVTIRASGGTTVVHRHGILNASLFAVDDCSRSTTGDAYDALCNIVRQALGIYGIVTDHGTVPGATCDGSHNIRWNGRKLGGTAAVIRRKNSKTIRLVHASLTISGNVHDDVEAVSAFEHDCGFDYEIDPKKHISVSDVLDHLP